MIHPKANPTKDGTATRPTPHVAQTGDPSETVRRRVLEEGGGAWVEGSATEGAWVGREARGVGAGREDGGERVDGAGEGRWRGVRRRGLGVDGAGECMGVDACAADMLVTRTWLHHKHHCRLLRVSAQVERSMGAGSAAPCFAEARWEVSGAAGLIRWSWVSKKCAMHATDGQVVAETAGLLRRAHGCTTSIIAGCSGSVHK